MESFKKIAADVVTAYEGKKYIAGANPAADHIVDAIRKYTKWIVLAAAAVIDGNPNEFEDIPADRIDEFLEDQYLGFGATVADALESYAKDDLESGRRGGLGRLYEALDDAGGVDRFDWGSYADDGMTPTIGMHFVTMPVPAGEPGAYIFGS